MKAITTNIFSSSVLNEKGEVILYKESSENKEDAVKGERKSVEKVGLIQRLTTFLATHYTFRYNLLTEQVEYAERNDYEGIACWDRDVKRYIESDRIAPYRQS